MGRDNQPKARQLARKERKAGCRAEYERILIVSEGSKTEPQYFTEIKSTYRLHSANVQILPCAMGTAPIQVVKYAQKLFENGDENRLMPPKSFDRVYAVFDRDEHSSYFEALNLAKKLDKNLINDDKQPVSFSAIASIPCFELWLLLHYEDEEIHQPIQREEVIARLKRCLPSYEKGATGIFAATRNKIETARRKANALSAKTTADQGSEPYTDITKLVDALTKLSQAQK